MHKVTVSIQVYEEYEPHMGKQREHAQIPTLCCIKCAFDSLLMETAVCSAEKKRCRFLSIGNPLQKIIFWMFIISM